MFDQQYRNLKRQGSMEYLMLTKTTTEAKKAAAIAEKSKELQQKAEEA